MRKFLADRKRSISVEPDELWDMVLALSYIGGKPAREEAVPFLRDALRDQHVNERQLATTALGILGPDARDALPDLVKAFDDTDPTVRRNAVVAVGQFGKDAVSATPALVKLLDPQQPDDVRRYAVEAIGNIGTPAVEQALPALRRTLKNDPHWQVRQRVVWTLQFVPDLAKSGIVPDLELLLEDTDKGPPRLVRYEAAVLLGHRLKQRVSDKTIDVLVENLNDEIGIYLGPGQHVTAEGDIGRKGGMADIGEGDARYLPADALAEIGPRANRKDVIDSLKKLAATSKDPKARSSAEKALEKITGKKDK